MKQRQDRERKALAMMRARETVSALDIGGAAVAGERRAKHIPMSGRQAIGLQIAVALVRRGLARPTAGNNFRLVK